MEIKLSNNLTDHFRLVDSQKAALRKLGIATVRDLLFHFPTRYDEGGNETTVAGLVAGNEASVIGVLEKLETKKSWRSRIPVSEGIISDATGKIKVMWFHQPYIAKMWLPGTTVKATGKVSGTGAKLYLANPHLERVTLSESGLFERDVKAESGKLKAESLFSVYPESAGITSLWFRHAIEKMIAGGAVEQLEDPIPADILKRYNLPTLQSALVWIHAPHNTKDATAARKRFAFEEVFFIQLERQRERLAQMREKSFAVDASPERVDDFISAFPFEPTRAQRRAITTILADMKSGHPMSRLLEGDVGSGKTAVAATAAFAVVHQRQSASDLRSSAQLQVGYMAPTEILAKQHFESFIKYFETNPINIGLITGSGCFKFPSKVGHGKSTPISRAQLLKWVANGEIPILIGTHALIADSVQFKHLALVIIDEQHRFGVNQRRALIRRSTQKDAPQMDADTADTTDADGRNGYAQMGANKGAETFLYKDLSYAIRNACFAVHNALGAGHKEVVYQNALAEEFERRDIHFSREKQIDVIYRNKKVGTYQPDFLVENKIIVELKALPFMGTREKTQLWNYLKGTSYRLALLINFGTPKVDIHRIIFDTAREDLRSSAIHGRTSAEMLPHLLSMTATPIPRTLALTVYGDLDLTLIDEMPLGRKPIITEIIAPSERAKAYEKMRVELKEGRQAYVICPRIEEPDPDKAFALMAKSVTAEAKRLKKDIFPDYEIAILHSKMTPKEKGDIMHRYAAHDIDILVATSVIEVGVNVPNATMIFIEGAERFGLAQLHQLRGRVVRSSHQAYCFLCPETRGVSTLARLKALTTAKNGFELAEADLMQRGAGQLGGGKQWGISDVGMEALKNLKLVEAARTEAIALITKDESLSHYPALASAVAARASQLHFE